MKIGGGTGQSKKSGTKKKPSRQKQGESKNQESFRSISSSSSASSRDGSPLNIPNTNLVHFVGPKVISTPSFFSLESLLRCSSRKGIRFSIASSQYVPQRTNSSITSEIK